MSQSSSEVVDSSATENSFTTTSTELVVKRTSTSTETSTETATIPSSNRRYSTNTSSTVEQQRIGYLLVQLNNAVSEVDFPVLKLVARFALDISQQKLDNAKQLSDVFQLIENSFPPLKIALQFLLYILKKLHIHSPSLINDLNTYVEELEGLPFDYRKRIDFILVVSSVFCSLRKDKYESLKEIARRFHFPLYCSSRIDSRTCLLHMLLDKGAISPDRFGYLFAWLQVIDCESQQAVLRDYCKRYEIVEPDWRSLVPVVEEKYRKVSESDISQSYPPSFQESDPTISHSLPSTKRDETYFLKSPSSDTCSSPPIRAFNQTGLESSSSEYITDDTTPRQPVSSSTPEKTEIVMIGGRRSTILTDNLVSGLETRRDEGVASGNSTTHSNVDLEVERDDVGHRDLPFPSQEEKEENEKRHLSVQFQQTKTSDYSINVDITNTNHVQSNNIGPDGHPKKSENAITNLIRKLQQMKRYSFSIFILLCLCIVVAIGGGVATHHFKGVAPSSVNVLVGGNTTVLLGDFVPTSISSLTVTSSSLPNDDELKFYQSTTQPLVTSVKLPSKSSPINETAGNNNIELNYNPRNPIYTASVGTLMYYIQLRFVLLDNFSQVCSVVYLFDSFHHYNNFLNQDYTDPVIGYIQNYSLCVSKGDLRVGFFNQPFSLSLPHRGWFYVGISVPEGVDIGVNIIPTITIFEVSSDSLQPCSLNNWNSKSCEFQISHSKVPFSSHPVHVYASYTGTEVWNVTIDFKRTVWNLGISLSLGISGILLFLLLFVIVVLGVYCFCFWQKTHLRRRKYEPL